MKRKDKIIHRKTEQGRKFVLTKAQRTALEILSSSNFMKPVTCSAFAREMWPASRMHTKSSNQGNGATRGKAAWLCAGSYLAKLMKLGLVSNFCTRDTYGYYLTEKGREALAIGYRYK